MVKLERKNQHVPKDGIEASLCLKLRVFNETFVSKSKVFQSIAQLKEKVCLYKLLLGLGKKRSNDTFLELYGIFVSDNFVKKVT